MRSSRSNRTFPRALVAAVLAAAPVGCKPGAQVDAGKAVTLAPPTRRILLCSGVCSKPDPAASGRAAAEAAKAKLGAAPVKAVIVSECYEDEPRKAKVLEGVASVFAGSPIYGGSIYGAFTQAGVAAPESVAVLAIAGKDIDVAAACQTDLGAAALTMADHQAEIEQKLGAAGEALARQLPKTDDARLLIVIADAHSPKNGPLVAGIRKVVGDDFAITGGSVNKNAGQSFVYFQGRMLTDSAVALMLSGDFEVAMAGRMAKENTLVISTAHDAAAEALEELAKLGARPAAAIAFDCAGRKGRLQRVEDELASMQKAIGSKLPLFGTYNAGEIGPADVSEKQPGVRCSGVGWHVMFTVLGW